MPAYIKVFDHGTGPIAIDQAGKQTLEMIPVELHFKEDGDVRDKPSFAIVLDRPDSKIKVYGQFSLDTLQKALAELGYTLYQP